MGPHSPPVSELESPKLKMAGKSQEVGVADARWHGSVNEKRGGKCMKLPLGRRERADNRKGER